ncbi:hypothetical protein COO60DRAFT_1476314, partial [Scenedesmus sp. NREL 46B-D3]
IPLLLHLHACRVLVSVCLVCSVQSLNAIQDAVDGLQPADCFVQSSLPLQRRARAYWWRPAHERVVHRSLPAVKRWRACSRVHAALQHAPCMHCTRDV